MADASSLTNIVELEYILNGHALLVVFRRLIR